MSAIPLWFQLGEEKPGHCSEQPIPPPGLFQSRALAVFFGLFLFCSAFSIAASQISLALCLILFVWLLTQGSTRVDDSLRPVLFAWSIYLLWLVVSSVVNDNVLRSLSAIREEWLLVILPIGGYLHRRPDWSRRLMLVLGCALLLASAYGIIQHFTGVSLPGSHALHRAGTYWRLSGNFSHPLTYGYYVVTATVFFLVYLIVLRKSIGRWSRSLLAVTVVAGLGASALCNSRGPMLALVVGLAAAGFLVGKWKWIVAITAATVLLLFVFSPDLPQVFAGRIKNDLLTENQSGRLFIWSNSLKIAGENPAFGCGPGNFPAAYTAQLGPEAKTGSVGHAHNDFIHQAATGGFPALGLYLVFWAVVLLRLWQTRRRAGETTAAFALSTGALAASAAFLAGSVTEAAIADEELRQVLFALWAAGLSQFSPAPAHEAKLKSSGATLCQ